MNLIEAWNTAKEGQVIRSNRIRNIIKKEGDYMFIKSFPSWATCLNDEDMLGDDWEIEKEKEKEKKAIVIENITWYKNNLFGALIPCSQAKFDWEGLLDKPPMKMTLEWEE